MSLPPLNAIKAFEVNAIDYLLKPIRRERLLAALGKVRAAPPLTRQTLDAGAYAVICPMVNSRRKVMPLPRLEMSPPYQS